MRKRARILVLIGAVIVVCGMPMAMNFQTKLVYNPSLSASIGFYWIEAGGDLKRGAYTVAPTPPAFRLLAAERHYLPFNVPLIKRVVALSGDEICRHDQTVFVNQEPVATALIRDSRDRFLPVWQGCLVFEANQFFALMDAVDSFDGRYFGLSVQRT